MRTPSSQKCRLDLAPPLADRFILGMVPIDCSPALLLMPFEFHLTVDTLRSTASSGFRSVLAVSSFRFRPRLDVSIPSASSGQRGYYPPLLDMAPLI
jgi:hypothetical protein